MNQTPPAQPGTVVFDQVGVRYGAHVALADISLSLAEQRIGIVGDNGSGKSTLARLINGLVLPTEGRVLVEGHDTATAGPAVRRRVGFVFQNPDNQLVMPVVAEDIAFGLKAHRVPAAEQGAWIDAVLSGLGISHLKDRACSDLSGGEKQLVALAGTLALDPAILVCDEPTAMLDRRNARDLMGLLGTLTQQVILVTHHVELLHDFDRVIVLEGGRVVADGSAMHSIAHYLERSP